jgi:hypothetical protein
MFCDYQWLGSGRVRFGWVLDGKIVYCHAFNHANSITTLYSQTATLPLRAESIGNGISSMEIGCVCVAFEGQDTPEGVLRSVYTGTTPRSISGSTQNFPLIALRKQSAYSKIPIDVTSMSVFASSSDDILVKVVKGAIVSGGAWVSASVGFSEYNVTATSYTGGREIYAQYLRGASTSDSTANISSVFSSTLNGRLGTFISNASEEVLISISNITSSTSVHGSISYREII